MPATPAPALPDPRVEASADVAADVRLGAGTRVWHLAQIREGAVLGEGCVVGRGAYVGIGVHVGDRCKIQNNALVYDPARLAAGVFVGPAAVLTNDRRPRAVGPDLAAKSVDDWEPVGVEVLEGASIGANATCVAPVVVGRWAMVAAGAVVTADVADHALVVGNPARRIGWVGRSGSRLRAEAGGRWTCPDSGEEFHEVDGRLVAGGAA